MQCPNCGGATYTAISGKEICPNCGYGRAIEPAPPQIVSTDGWKFHIAPPEGGTVIVDNRTLVLGLDKLYRDAMKVFEAKQLLACAEKVAAALRVAPAEVPIEGYYTESQALTNYFKLMRALQKQAEASEAVVRHLPEFQLLWEVTSSPLYGRPQRQEKLLPTGRDPLTQALLDLAAAGRAWNVPELLAAAHANALQDDDFSLVGLAARAQDPVCVAALRESVVLYAELVTFGIEIEPEYTYAWQVAAPLAAAANRFIEVFHRFVPNALPNAEAANAKLYYNAYTDNDIIGRCVRLGDGPKGNYHWAVAVKSWSPTTQVALGVDEFWSSQVWTTEAYREAQNRPTRMKLFAEHGVPANPLDMF